VTPENPEQRKSAQEYTATVIMSSALSILARQSQTTRFRTRALFLLALSAALYIGTAASPALIDDDADAAYAVVAREMLQRHDFVVPHMNGVRYLVRPPLHFWLVAATYTVLGQNAFSTRLPVALAMIGLVLLVHEFGRRFLSEQAGFYGGLITATSAGMFIFTRTMIPEAIYALQFTAIFYLFLRAWTGTLSHRAYWLASATCGLAVLTRGLIGLLFPLAAVVLFVTITRGWPRWRELRPFSSVLIFLAVALPWHILAQLREPGFFHAYIVNEHVNRALGTRWPHDYSAVPLWAWWLAHLAWFFPWSFFLPVAFRGIPNPKSWRILRDPQSLARLLSLLWAAVILIFFSLESGSRMEYYSFGAWPAIALLLGSALADEEQRRRPWLRTIQAVMLFFPSLVAAVLGYLLWTSYKIRSAGDISSVLSTRAPQYYHVAMSHFFDLTPQAFSALRAPAIIAGFALVISAAAAWWLRRQVRHWQANVAISIGMAGFFLAANLAYAAFSPQLSSHALAKQMNTVLRPEDAIVLYGDFPVGASIAFYTGHHLLLYRAHDSNLEYGARFAEAPKTFLSESDFQALWYGRSRVFLLVPPDQMENATRELQPESRWLLAESGGKRIYINRPVR
jgi:4-amino-4-deoxy-L-arabinose transferase-like glycosyltransferase